MYVYTQYVCVYIYIHIHERGSEYQVGVLPTQADAEPIVQFLKPTSM